MAREYDHLFKLLIIGDSGKYAFQLFNKQLEIVFFICTLIASTNDYRKIGKSITTMV